VSRSLNICIVTADIVGPIRNGGIGTAYYNLALALVNAGHRVTVLYTLGSYCENKTVGHWQRHYRRLGVDFVPAPPTNIDGHSSIKMAHAAYEWIKTRRFDVVHCHEWRGVGFYIALGKRQGLCLKDAVLCVGAHSPVMWCLQGMNELADAEALEVDFMERQSVALADVLWTPSRHMRRWLEADGWVLPRRTITEPYILLGLTPSAAGKARAGSELVFFGRLETRKGLDLFCDALDRLARQGLVPPRVTFLGKTSTVAGLPTEDYLKQRSKRWSFPWTIVSTLDRDGAMAYLRQPNRVAVLPSRLDNLPYTVLECLGSGIPFVASNIGGIPEMIRPRDRARLLFALTADSLANRLADVLRRGLVPAPLRIPVHHTVDAWVKWHASAHDLRSRSTRRLRGTDPRISVCLTTRNRPTLLSHALDSLRRQDYRNFEVVLVDDGSDMPEALAGLTALEPEFAQRNWQILRRTNRYVGAARNAAVAAARGEYVLFMDDDNVAAPSELSIFARAARHSGADVLTCLMTLFQGDRPRRTSPRDRIWPFLGGALVPGLLKNVFGDANALFKRSVFERIGGFHEEFGVSGEDWELLARAVLNGLTVQVVPEPLVRYRQSSHGMLQTTSSHANSMRALRPYFELLPPHLRPLVHLSRARPGATAASRPAPPARLDHVRRAVIFGTGEAGRLALDLAARCGWKVPYLVDNNPSVWHTTAHGLPVRNPNALAKNPADLVIVASLAGKPAISSQLQKMGLEDGKHFVHFLDPVRRGHLVTQIQL
jgi:glycosyltransferase involved in cell wall biosynthesis/GT2 family glycosyltransferase